MLMTLSKQLRKFIKESGLSQYEIVKRAGVAAPSLGRFMRKERGLSLTVAEKIASVLDLELAKRRKKK